MSRIGLHVSAAGGLENAPKRAQELGCECFQFFSRSPRGGGTSSITEETARSFRSQSKHYGFESYIHAPYYINFASENNRVSFGSVSAIREELQRGTLLGVTYVVTHLGSASDLGETAALKQVVGRLDALFDAQQLGRVTTKLLIEFSAGAGGIIGDTFAELSYLLKHLKRRDVGICLDTCHLFASGYDLRTPEALAETMREFRQNLPLTRLKLLHANDSRFGLGEHKDRHTDIGDGKLGVDTFRHLLARPEFQRVNFVLETPGADARRKKDVALLKHLRG